MSEFKKANEKIAEGVIKGYKKIEDGGVWNVQYTCSRG